MAEPLPLDLITAPGVYDMPAERYHADPVPGGSLSSSGARRLLPPSCPALFKYEQDHTQPYRKAFDVGSAAHMRVLGVGPQIEVVPGERWDTKVAKAAVAAAREAGRIPLKEAEAEHVEAMAAALRDHPVAGPLFRPGTGRAEQSLFWVDRHTGVWCRARLDWLPDADPETGQLIIPEYKTTRSAAPVELPKPAYDHGYHVQTWFYEEACRALRLSPAPVLVHVWQEKEPPYLVSVTQPRATFVNLGGLLARDAMGIYAACVASGQWPGYTTEVEWLDLPGWVENKYGKEIQ